MINYEIAEREPLSKNPSVVLWLRKDEKGVTVAGKGENGCSSNLVRFQNDGRIHMCHGVNENLPFILKGSRIATTEQ